MAIDVKHLNHSVFDDVGLRAEVLVLFVEQAQKILDQFDPDLDDSDWRHLAHTLKGSARGVGAFALGDLLAEAEALCGDVADKRERRVRLLSQLYAQGGAAIEAAQALSRAA